MTTVAIMGAGGNMGRRITRGLRALGESSGYGLRLIERSEAGLGRIADEGGAGLITSQADGLAGADIVIFAVPDRIVREVAPEVIAALDPGTSILFLDPAAVAADRIPEREGISCFVTHPTHPPLYSLLSEEDPAAREDYWGGGLARQCLVLAHAWGPEEPADVVERLCRDMFAPITRSHRITVHQMALLEPALTETLTNGCVAVIREGLEEVIARGVPAEAATDFLWGHLQIGIALIFDRMDWKLSEGAQTALAESKEQLFRDGWKDIFAEENLQASLRRITGGDDEPGAALPSDNDPITKPVSAV